MTIEQLTNEERAAFTSWQKLRAWPELRDKALRIIDALSSESLQKAYILSLKTASELRAKVTELAADRAALVAQLEAARTYSDDRVAALAEQHRVTDRLKSQVAELTRERDEAHTRADHNAEAAQTWHAEVTRLTRERGEARKAAEELARYYEAEKRSVNRLTDELKAASTPIQTSPLRSVAERSAAAWEPAAAPALAEAETQVTRLTEALAAAERRTRTELARVDAAEARVRELEAEVKAERDSVREFSRKTREAESECAALRAEVDRLRRAALNEAGHAIASEDRLAAANALLLTVYSQEYIDTHLAAQPATAPARDEGEQKYPVRLGHTVRVQQEDGSVRVECDHTFKGTASCGHCGMQFSELARRGLSNKKDNNDV